MEWLKKNASLVLVLGVLFSGWWNISNRLVDLDKHINHLDVRLTRIETVMIMQKIMPKDLALLEDETD